MSYRHLFELLAKALPFTEAVVISSLPRGSLQIVQPAKVSEALLKSYSKDFHAEDRATWRAIAEKRVLRGDDAFDDGLQQSRYYTGFMEPLGLRYLAVAPLTAPVLQGYAGALHVYRAADLGDFTAAELEKIGELTRQLDEAIERTRSTRRSGTCAEDAEWSHRPPVRQFVFDHNAKPQVNDQDWLVLDERLREQMVRHARQRLHHLNGHDATSDRLQLPDSRGDLWTFRVVVHKKYPALGEGASIFFCLQPDSCDWSSVRPADFQADAEIARLVPAMQFMQENFHRGPTLTEISKTVHLSPFHFHRRFTELLGMTPKHFLLECQIYQAKLELVSGTKDLVDIASSCGFAHQSHFTSRFKQATGLTPTRWRKLATRGEAAVK